MWVKINNNWITTAKTVKERALLQETFLDYENKLKTQPKRINEVVEEKRIWLINGNVIIVWIDKLVIRKDNGTDGLRKIVIKVEVKE